MAGWQEKEIETKKTDRNMNILDTEQMGRYRAYLEEYKGYYANAQSDEERNEILRKVEELCQAEFGVPADKLYIMGIPSGAEDWIEGERRMNNEERQRLEKQQNKPTQDIKKLKVTVIVLLCVVIYLLTRR